MSVMHEPGCILCKLICHLRATYSFLNLAARMDFTTIRLVDLWESMGGKDCITQVDTSPGALIARDCEKRIYYELYKGQLKGHSLAGAREMS